MTVFFTEFSNALQRGIKTSISRMEHRGKKIPNQEAKYLEEKFGLRFRHTPTVRIVELKKIENSNRSDPRRPRFNNRLNEIHISPELANNPGTDDLEPTSIALFEENGHAYFAQKRPDLRLRRLKIVDEAMKKGGLSVENVNEFVQIMMLDEGLAGYLRRRVGEQWCIDKRKDIALKSLRFRDILDHDSTVKIRWLLTLDENSRIRMIDETLNKFSIEKIKLLHQQSASQDENEIKTIMSDMSKNNADLLIKATDKLDRISYRSGVTFVQTIIERLINNGFNELQAIQWIIDKGPFPVLDYFKPEKIIIPDI